MNLIPTKWFRTQQNLTIGCRTLKKDFLKGSRSQSQNKSGQTIYSKQKIKSLTNRGQGALTKRPKSLDDLIVPRGERSMTHLRNLDSGHNKTLWKGHNKMDVAPATYHERSDTWSTTTKELEQKGLRLPDNLVTLHGDMSMTCLENLDLVLISLNPAKQPDGSPWLRKEPKNL
jgi:hypothetical protein